MPPKKDLKVENMKARSKMYNEILTLVDIDNVQLIEQLQGEERREFAKWCHTMFHSEFFDLLVNNFVYAAAMLVTERFWDQEAYSNGVQGINGLWAFRDLIEKYANIFDTDYSGPKEVFDPYKPFSQPKI